MPVSVTIFNTSFVTLNMQANNGLMFSVPGASPVNGAPQSPATGGPTWSGHFPGPNQLGPGQNRVMVTSPMSPSPVMLNVSLPAHMQWTSVQLYVFIHSNQQVGWVVLNNGTLVTGNIS
jgi:hypothetical protein